MFVRKVPGNFHISTHNKGLALTAIPEANITARHKINLLEITKEDSEITQGYYIKTTNPLDGMMTTWMTTGIDVEYYLKVLDSTYNHAIWGQKRLFEYVAHANFIPSRANIPKIEFKYEFDPISMNYTHYRSNFVNFLISLCAIIGGIVASSVLLDKLYSQKLAKVESS